MVSIFKMCRKYLIKNKYCVIWYGFLCLTSSIFSMISPYISGNFIDYLIVADDISKIYQYCFVFFGLFVINQLIGYIVNRVYIKMQTQMFALYWNAYRKHIKWKEIWYDPGKIFMRL